MSLFSEYIDRKGGKHAHISVLIRGSGVLLDLHL